MRMLRRLRLVLLVIVLGVVLGPVPAARAAWCDGDAPLPATPLTGGGFTTTPPQTSTGDPFVEGGPPLASVYGWHYQMVTYDTGCTPGSSIMPNTGTEIANGISQGQGLAASIGHGLMSAVVSPTWLEPIDSAVAQGVSDVRASTWAPYLGLSVLVVAVLMLWATRVGRLDGTVTAGVWALIVLGVVTYLGSYPLHATSMVDDAVKGTVTAVASSFGGSEEAGPQEAVDAQWDDLQRNTAYRTWLEGSLGSATGTAAANYGPALFRSTHLTWAEAQVLDADPDAGQEIIEAKGEDFKELAEQIEDEDPYAYSYLQGEQWGSRISTALTGLVAGLLAMAFLVVAPIGIFVAFVVIRVAVMFSPAAGVIFMIEKFRVTALGVMNRIGKYVVMGPLWLIAGLIVLRLNSAVVSTGGISMLMKIVLCFVISLVAWLLLKPVSGIPGVQTANRGMHRVLRTVATGWAASKVARAADGKSQSREQDASDPEPQEQPGQSRPVFVGNLQQTRPVLGAGFAGAHRASSHENGARDVPEYSATPHRETAGPQQHQGPVSGGLRPGGLAMSGHRQRHLSSSPSLIALPAGAVPDAQGAQAEPGQAATGPVQGGPPQEQTPAGASGSQASREGLVAGAGLSAPPVVVPVIVADPDTGTTGQQGRPGEHADTSGQRVDEKPQEHGVVATGSQQRSSQELVGSAAPGAFVPATESPGDGQPAGELEDERGHTTLSGAIAQSTSGSVAGGESSGGSVGLPAREQPASSGRVLSESEQVPAHVHEANLTYGTDHRPVFQIYRPGGESVRHVVDEQ